MTLPRVVLIGGPPYVGKSAVARCIAARHDYGCIATDDIGKAVRAVQGALARQSPDPMSGRDWREYFAATPVSVLLEHDAVSRKRLWPAIDRIVRAHASWDDPIVIEGYALWPEQVMAAGFTATGAVWLTGGDRLLASRVRSNPAFYAGAADEEALIGNFVRRSSRYGELMCQSALRCGASVIAVLPDQPVDEIADRCVVALVRQSAGGEASRHGGPVASG
jgi:2-phosphoglycerate kinase